MVALIDTMQTALATLRRELGLPEDAAGEVVRK
jgi:hypothetical protein